MAKQKRALAKNAKKVEKKETFVVLKGIVGLPDEDGNITDLHPYEMKNGVPVRDKNQELKWKYMEIQAFPSKVGHMVVSGSLILKEEFDKFYGDGEESVEAPKDPPKDEK